MKSIKFNYFLNSSYPAVLYTNDFMLGFPSSHPRFFSTSISLRNLNNNNNNNEIIKIDKGLWKVLILPFKSFDAGVNELFNSIKPDKNYALLIQGSYHNQFISIGPKILFNKQTSKDFIHEYFQYYLDLLATENYEVDEIKDIILRYRDTEILRITQPNLPKIDKSIKPIIPKSFLFEKYFPASASNDNFGEISNVSQNDKGQDVYTFEYNKFTIIRTQINNNLFHNEVRLGEKPFTSFIDKIIESGPDYNEPYFIRTINEKFKLYYALNNKKIFKQEAILRPKFMKSIQLSFDESNLMISFDIEAYLNKNKEFIPYSCGWYDGSNAKTYYLTDFQNSVDMIAEAYKDIFEHINSSKNHDKKHAIYVHNLAHFDGLYIIEALQKLGEVKPLLKDNKIIYLDASHQCSYIGKGGVQKERKIKIRLFDSYQLMPINLRDLAKDFNCDTQKGHFPYSFVQEHNLNYVGPVPPISSFDISDKEYDNMVKEFNSNWSLKDETIKYLEKDCISLYEILLTFSKEIFNEYNLNITKYATISSLAMNIFRGHYLDESKKIPLLTGHVHSEIRQGYHGGAVEIYKPSLREGYHYDVNSLYPAAMLQPMPIGDPIYSNESDLNKIFGFSYVKVEAPKTLKIPILPFKNNEGITIFPTGSWHGMYFSEELKEAVKYGYKVSVLYSYIFEKADLFSDYVNGFYEKKSINKGPKRAIAKLFLNSLYGRFGLKEIMDKTILVDKKEAEKIYSIYEIKEAYSLNNGYELIRYSSKPELDRIQVPEVKKDAAKLIADFEHSKSDSNSSIAIAAAITAYARVHMNQYKFIPDNPMYATDTDSGIFEKPLPDYMMGSEIGKMKLEKTFTDGYFLAPKVYGYIMDNGKPHVVAKGVGSNLSYGQIEFMYNSNSPVEVSKDVWVKDIVNYKIKLETRKISLTGELTKREKIFNSEGKWVDTRPLEVKDGVVISELTKVPAKLLALPAPNYKLLTAPVSVEKPSDPDKGTKKITPRSGVVSKEEEIRSLIRKLEAIDKNILTTQNKLDECAAEAEYHVTALYETLIMIGNQDKLAIMKELNLLGVEDPYNYKIEKENVIYLPAPSPVVIYLNAPPTTSLLCLPAPNYKLLAAPKIIIETPSDGGNKIKIPNTINLPAPLPQVIYLGDSIINNKDIKEIKSKSPRDLHEKIKELEINIKYYRNARSTKDLDESNLNHYKLLIEKHKKAYLEGDKQMLKIMDQQINNFSKEDPKIMFKAFEQDLKDYPLLINFYSQLQEKFRKNTKTQVKTALAVKPPVINLNELSTTSLLALPAPNYKLLCEPSIIYNNNDDKPNKKIKARIQEIIDSIKNTENFNVAMTHKSCRNENKNLKSYETFEFMGDKLLDKYISLFIFDSFPEYDEGDLTKLNNSLVSGKNLSALSRAIGLDKYLKLNKSLEEQIKQGKINDQKILGDIFESFITALFKEKGEKILFEFLCLTVLNRPEFKDKLKIYKFITNKDHFKIDEKK